MNNEYEAEYSQGIMTGAGAVVLKDGQPLTVDEIVSELNELQAARAHGVTVPMKRIAEKKLDQMGATVHGVLVCNEAGAWAAVSEAGRVMWLHSFEGQDSSAQAKQPSAGVVPEGGTFADAIGDPWKADKKDYDHSIHTNPNASAWADFFMETFPDCGADRDTMHGWFANAMMAMYDHLQNRPTTSAVQGGGVRAWGPKPCRPGYYLVRGYDDDGTEALVQVAFDEDDDEFVCNLHDKNSDPVWRFSNLMREISERFEWLELSPVTTHPHTNQPDSEQAEQSGGVTYSSTQSTKCAGCMQVKHTPLRVDHMGGYVCLSCIDKELHTRPHNGEQGGEWVSVKDKQPPILEQCLGWNATANMINKANTYRLFTAAMENTCDISHWMPLPQPPKSKEGES